jgi:hypothetical protein
MLSRHRLPMAAALAAAMQILGPISSTAAEIAHEATYTISIGGLPVGKAETNSRFTEAGYATIIEGTTSGVSRIFSNAKATLLGSGRFSGRRVEPISFSLETSESGFETHVRMAMRAGTITSVLASPQLREASDRVPIKSEHKRDIVDPVGAFLVIAGGRGSAIDKGICDRTIEVFDGWQRFDIALFYKETRLVTGVDGAYDGKVVKCGARYIPIAGHRKNREETKLMAANERFEVWYAPIEGMRLLIPYRILIGTKFGDLVIASTRFVTIDPSDKTTVKQ